MSAERTVDDECKRCDDVAGAQPAAVTQYKVIVAGDGGTGKTAWLAKLLGNDFPTTYNPTLGVAVRPIDEESVRFSMWDCAGQEKFGGLRDGYYIGGQAAVIFFDLGSHVSFANMDNWHQGITRVCGDVPVIVVGSKCDLAERVVAPETIAQFVEARGLVYVELSAKEDINTRKPLELLAARLTNETSAGPEPTTPQSVGSLFGSASTEFSWPSELKREPKVESGGGLFDGTGPGSGSGGLFGTSTTGGSQLFGNSGFSNASAPMSGGGLFGADGGAGAQPAAVTQYKVIVAGDGGTGKTAWLAKLLGNDFPTTYNPTLGVAVRPVDEESVRFSMWDCAGQEKFGGLRDGYFIGGQAAVIFFDLSSRATLSHVTAWHRDIIRVCDNIPIVVVGAKCDLGERVVTPGTVPQFVEDHGLEYVELSAKEDINTRKPLELLVARLTKAMSAGAQ